MSQLYRHLLIPPVAEFIPTLESVGLFFSELESAGAMPGNANFVVVTRTGRALFGRNPETGEPVPMPELKVDRFGEMEPALSSITSSVNFDLLVRGFGPTAIPPFDLYSADNYATSVLGEARQEKYEYEVHCQLRDKVEQVHWSAFGGDQDADSGGRASIRSPWTDKPIFSSGLSHSRFTVEFGIGDYLMPRITDSAEILSSHLVAMANKAFDTKFTQGCRVNED